MVKSMVNVAFLSFVLFGSFSVFLHGVSSEKGLDFYVNKCRRLPESALIYDEPKKCIFVVLTRAKWTAARNYVCRKFLNSKYTKLYIRKPDIEHRIRVSTEGSNEVIEAGYLWTSESKCDIQGANQTETCLFGALKFQTDATLPVLNQTVHWCERNKEHSALCEVSENDRDMTTTTETASSITLTTSTPTPETEASTPKTTTSTQPASATCKSETDKYGNTWDHVPVGTTGTRECPTGAIGFAEWKCSEKGEFVTTYPSYANCVQVWLHKLNESKDMEPVEVLEELANKTGFGDDSLKYGGDILTSVVIVETSLERFLKSEDSMEKTDEFSKSAAKVFNNTITQEQAWEDLNHTARTKSASKFLKQLEKVGSVYSCGNVVDHEGSPKTIFLDNIVYEAYDMKPRTEPITFPAIEFLQKKGKIVIPGNLTSSLRLSSSKWSCEKLRGTGIVYRTDQIGEYLGPSDESNSKMKGYVVNSKLISFKIGDLENANLGGQNVKITLQHTDRSNMTERRSRCVFWNFTNDDSGFWDDSGCERVSSNETYTICKCNHLTNFAVLTSVWAPAPESLLLRALSYFCCSLSTVSLIITILVLQGFRTLRCQRSTATCNIAVCLIIVNLIILFGMKQSRDEKILCFVVALCLHYFLLAASIWMLIEGILLYQMIIVVFTETVSIRRRWLRVVAYGLPLVIVGITAGISQYQGYTNNEYCWLSQATGDIWAFLGPMALVIVANLVFLIMALHAAANVKGKKLKGKVERVTKMIKGCFFLLCLLGIPWIFGYFYEGKSTLVFGYLAVFVNGLQGFFIFLFQILFNEKARTTLLMFLKNRNLTGNWVPPPHSTAHLRMQRQGTRTTENGMSMNTSSVNHRNSDRPQTRISIIS